MSLIGIDLGTSGVRAGAFDVAGREVASRAVRLPLHRTRGRVELDPGEILTAITTALRELVGLDVVRADPPEAVSFSTQGEAVLALDPDGRPTSWAPVSMDPRGAASSATLGDSLGSARFQELTGQPLHPMFSVFKIVADLDGAWSGSQRRYACLDTFVASALGAPPVTDQTMAARTGAFDVGSLAWSDEVLATVSATTGVGIAANQLPAVVPAGRVVGSVTQEAAARFHLPAGLPIVAGAHDQAAAWVGVGGTPDGVAAFTLGSSDCFTVGTPQRPSGLDGTGLATYPLAPDLWLTLAGTAAGGWSLEWLAGLVGSSVAELFSAIPEEPSPLVVLPYLAGSGTLDNDPAARGLIAGLTLTSERGDIARALVESAGYELAKIIDALHVRGIAFDRIIATGGGAGNTRALAARSDAAGVALESYPGHASLRGAAMLAGLGVGLIDQVPPPVSDTPAHTPRDQAWYARQRRAYAELYAQTRPIDLPTRSDKEHTRP